jgi:hypothetical protein
MFKPMKSKNKLFEMTILRHHPFRRDFDLTYVGRSEPWCGDSKLAQELLVLEDTEESASKREAPLVDCEAIVFQPTRGDPQGEIFVQQDCDRNGKPDHTNMPKKTWDEMRNDER